MQKKNNWKQIERDDDACLLSVDKTGDGSVNNLK
jgi:hypothetical protein